MKSHETPINALQILIESHKEWLLSYQSGETFSLQNHEIEFEIEPEKTLLSFLENKGFQTWRLIDFEIEEEVAQLILTRNFGTEEAKFKLVPRAKAEELSEAVELARLERANKIAAFLASEIDGSKLKRVELNKENGRFAQIILENGAGVQTAILSDVSDSLTPEILLSSAILWVSKLQRRKKNPIDKIWILAEKKKVKNLQKLHALLNTVWKTTVEIKEISRTKSKTDNIVRECLTKCKTLKVIDLWRFKAPKLKVLKDLTLSDTSREVIKIASGKIDHLFSKNGETLRYLGLPFFRVRTTLDKERGWFGIEKPQKALSENSFEELDELLENLKTYRHFDSPNKHHAFFQAAPEAWLESMLRNNIKQLDANLILSPIYNQFRTSRDKIDLLALRKDGRLIIIELKVAADREMIFQAVDYWRKIELQRRTGQLNKAKLFGDLDISDKPAIVYLVAPTLSYHRDFNFLAKTISNEIEIFKFDMAENWRENLKVLGRRKIG